MMNETERKAHQNIPPVICYPVHTLPAPDLPLLSHFRSENVEKSVEILVPAREARCFESPLGGFFRITSIEGPQVGDLNLWHKGTKRHLRGREAGLSVAQRTNNYCILSSSYESSTYDIVIDRLFEK